METPLLGDLEHEEAAGSFKQRVAGALYVSYATCAKPGIAVVAALVRAASVVLSLERRRTRTAPKKNLRVSSSAGRDAHFKR